MKLSVVMPVRNASEFLPASVGSIVAQTFRDFELIILDDGSTDDSHRILQQWAARDSRIRLHRSDSSLGVVGSSNFVVGKARSPIVARMDADDVSHPERLARQFAIFERSADTVLAGTLHDGIDERGRTIRPRDRWRLMRPSLAPPFAHGSAMFRRRAFEECGGYRDACAGWEDNDLFLRLASRGRCVVIPDVLYHYRYHLGSSSVSTDDEKSARSQALRSACMGELRAGRDYSHLLMDGGVVPPTGEAYRYAAAMRVWAGYPARSFRTMLSHGASIRSLAWSAWASVSPQTLRFAIRTFLRARDRAASLFIREGEDREWRYA